MFTGIVEATGTLIETKEEGTNLHFKIRSTISSELKVDQSLNHDGVCLTVTEAGKEAHWVTAVEETLKKSNLSAWTVGSEVNLERCLPVNGRYDGHIVQGHVDSKAYVLDVNDVNGSWLFRFRYDDIGEVLVEKGSVCLNGVSLTCFDIVDKTFHVAIIPYTYEHTNFKFLRKNDVVNIEFDILGKYIRKLTKA